MTRRRRLRLVAAPCAVVAALALAGCGGASGRNRPASPVRDGANSQQVAGWNTDISRSCDTESNRAVYVVAGGTGVAVASVPADCATLPPKMNLQQGASRGVRDWNADQVRICDPQTGALLYVVAGGTGVAIDAVPDGCPAEGGLGR